MNRTQTFVVAGLAGVVLLTGSAAYAGSSPQAPSVKGAWTNVVDPQPNPGGDPPPFATRIAFAGGGVVTEATSSIPPGYVSGTAGVGSWKQKGRTVTFTFERFLNDANGYAAIQRIQGTETISKDGKQLTGTATATILAPDGTTVLKQFGVTASGTRLAP